MWKEKHQ